jgi:hypothetical protein
LPAEIGRGPRINVVAGNRRAAVRCRRGPCQADPGVTPRHGQPGRRPWHGRRGGRYLARRLTLTGRVDRGHPEVIRGSVDQTDQHEDSAGNLGDLGGPREISRSRIVDVVAADRRAAVRRGRGPRQADPGVIRRRGQSGGRPRRLRRRGGRHLARLTLASRVDRRHLEVIRGPVDEVGYRGDGVPDAGERFAPGESRRGPLVDVVAGNRRAAVRRGPGPLQGHLGVTLCRGQPGGCPRRLRRRGGRHLA